MRRDSSVSQTNRAIVVIAGVFLALSTIVGCERNEAPAAEAPAHQPVNAVQPTSTAGNIVESDGPMLVVRDRTGREWHVRVSHQTQIAPEGAILTGAQSAVVVGPATADGGIDAVYIRVLASEPARYDTGNRVASAGR